MAKKYTIKTLKNAKVNTAQIFYSDGSVWVENIREAIKDYEKYLRGVYGNDDNTVPVNIFYLDKYGKVEGEEGEPDDLSVLLEYLNDDENTGVVLNAVVPADVERLFPTTNKGYKTAVYGKNKPKNILSNLEHAYRRML